MVQQNMIAKILVLKEIQRVVIVAVIAIKFAFGAILVQQIVLIQMKNVLELNHVQILVLIATYVLAMDVTGVIGHVHQLGKEFYGLAVCRILVFLLC